MRLQKTLSRYRVCTITSSHQSLVASILSAGPFFGAPLAAPVADFLGGRWLVVLTVFIFVVGVAMQAAATALTLFAVGYKWFPF